MEVFAQIIGFIGTGCFFISYQLPTKKKIVTAQFIACTLCLIHFYMLGAMSGAVMNTISFVKTALYCFEGKIKFNKLAVTVFFCACIIVCGVVFYDGVVSLLPVAAMLINTVAYTIKKEQKFRLVMISCEAMWLVYAICIGSIGSLIGDVIVLASVIGSFIRFMIAERRKSGIDNA